MKTQGFRQYTIYTAAIRLCRNHEPMIRTEYVHNTHYENLPQPDETPHFENLSLDIYRILWYTKIVIDSMHAFLLGGVGRLAYVRRDPPVHVVRFVRYVNYYDKGLLCPFAEQICSVFVWILPNDFAAARHIGETKGRFVSVRLFAHYGKTPTIQPPKALLQ